MKGNRPWPFFLHSLLGLKLCVFFGFVCLTGTVATVSHEIRWLAQPKVRAGVTDAPASWGTLWDAARATHPQVVFAGIARQSSGYESYLARIAYGIGPDGRPIEVFLDPARAGVTGSSTGTTFPALMRGLHYYLLAPTSIPFYAVSSLGIVMLVSLVSGLLVYRKFWRGFFRWPRWHKDPRVWWGDVHRLVGLWSVWFVLAIGVTSVWYLAEWAGWLEWEPERALRVAPTERTTPDGERIDRWAALAQARMPGLHITGIHLPDSADGTVTVQGQWRAWLVRERTNAVAIDPGTDRIVDVRDAQAMRLSERIVHTADPLHFGDFLGLASKLVWVVFGLALVSLAASGAVVYLRRTAKSLRALAGHAPRSPG